MLVAARPSGEGTGAGCGRFIPLLPGDGLGGRWRDCHSVVFGRLASRISIGMQMQSKIVLLVVAGMLLAMGSLSVNAAKYYRWVDDKGETHYGTEVPPQYLQQQHKQINEQGVTTRVHQRTKTPEEAAAEAAEKRRRAKMRAAELQVIEKQKQLDRILLETYSSLDDMELARDGKIAAIEAVIRITKSNIIGVRSEMSRMTSDAANRERSGQTVPPKLSRQIKESQQQLQENLAFIGEQRKEQQRVHDEFEREMKRYARLRSVQQEKQREAEVFAAQGQAASMVRTKAGNATVLCSDEVRCAKAWELAKRYVGEVGGPEVQLATASLIMTYEPRRDEDIGMYIARYPETDGSARIVIELVCAESPGGAATCKSEAASKLRLLFKRYVEAGQ